MSLARRRRLTLAALAAVAAAVPLAALVLLDGSRPHLEGRLVVAGLEHAVAVERDAGGVPTVTGQTRTDVAFATGFLHAQERFWSMDAMRRDAAGELSELFGAAALAHDRGRRLHRLRAVAEAVVAGLPAADRALLAAYAGGVNAGLEALAVRPALYLLLRAAPRRWTPADTILVVHAMALVLQDETAARDAATGVIFDALPAPLARYLTQDGTAHDAPLAGAPRAPLPVPGPEVVDLRAAPPPDPGPFAVTTPAPGSNAFAVDARRSATGHALVASDMHLAVRWPNVWYRMRLRVRAGPGTPALDLAGLTLPGTPALVAGSTGRGGIAWGFTNAYADAADRVLVARVPGDPGRYRVPGGTEPFAVHEEVIRVRGAPEERLRVRATRWGPVLGEDHRGRLVALRWTGHLPGAFNLGLLELERARSLDAALALAPAVGIPAQNAVITDGTRIAWTIMGRIPARAGIDPARPSRWDAPGTGWTGWLDAAAYPRVVDPAGGRIWSANQRKVDGAALARLGDAGYRHGWRGRQIRDRLAALPAVSAADLLAIQTDDEALFMQRWARFLGRVLDEAPEAARAAHRAGLRAVLARWDGHAGPAPAQAGYYLARRFRERLLETVLAPFVAICRERDPGFTLHGFNQLDAVVWQLATERPPHLLPSGHRSWERLLAAVADAVAAELAVTADPAYRVVDPVPVEHPVWARIPLLGAWLAPPPLPYSTDPFMPLAAMPRHADSARFAVSPGREGADAYFHAPAGQSSHPLAGYRLAGHADYLRGRPAPFLPGPPAYRLALAPRR